MANKLPHCTTDYMEFPPSKTTFVKSKTKTPQVPSGEVSTQKRGGGGSRTSGPDVFERGRQRTRYTEHTAPGGRQSGLAMNSRTSAMPQSGHQSATAPGALASPGSERNSSTMDARSSVPTSIQQGPNTRDRFGGLEYGDNDSRMDNAELDDGTGTGRRSRGAWRGARRM